MSECRAVSGRCRGGVSVDTGVGVHVCVSETYIVRVCRGRSVGFSFPPGHTPEGISYHPLREPTTVSGFQLRPWLFPSLSA